MQISGAASLPVDRRLSLIGSIALAVAVSVAYFFAAQLSLGLLTKPDGVAVFWPAAGISSGILIALGPRVRLPVTVGVLIASTVASLVGDRSIAAAAVFALSNAGEPLLVAWLVKRQFGDDFRLESLPSVLGFFAAAGIGPAISGSLATVGFILFYSSTAPVLTTWLNWLASDALGIIMVAPLLIGLSGLQREFPDKWELAAGTLTLVLLVLITAIAFSSPAHYWYTALPLATLLPALLAAYCSPVFAAAAALTLGFAVVWTTTFGIGDFGEPRSLHDGAYAGRATLLAISTCTLLLAALFAERRHKEAALKESNERLARDITDRKNAESALAERTMQLAIAGKAALVGSFTYDVDTERLQITPGYAAIHGFPDGTTEIARSEWQAGVHPEDRVRWGALRSRAHRERWQEYSGEYRIVRSGNEVRWIEARVLVSYASDGRPQRAVGIDIDVTARKRADEQQRTLNAELDHRVKNVLATVSAIITQTPKAGSSLADFVAGLDGRIKSLARTHELLSQNQWQDVSLEEIVQREIAPYAAGNATILGPGVALKAEAAQALATVLHELATNAAKYGALSTKYGRVSIRWHWQLNGTYQLAFHWQELGGPAVVAPSNSGYGMSLIREVIPYELGGTADFAITPEGARCKLEIPVDWFDRDSWPCGSDISSRSTSGTTQLVT